MNKNMTEQETSSTSPSQVPTPSSTNSKNGDGNPTTPMTIVPTICNPSSHNATSRNITTPEDLSMFFEKVQLGNQVHHGQWM